jgi:arginine exporter protein ArgO
MFYKIAVGGATGLIMGSMAGTLPTFQFFCFAIGVSILSFVYFNNMKTKSEE